MRVSLTKDLAPLRAAAFREVETRAAAARAVVLTPGKDAVYAGKLGEALSYLAAGQPDDLGGFPFLRAETGVTASNASDLAELWIARDRDTLELVAAIERATMTAKAAVSLAASPAEIDAVIQDLAFD